MTTTTAPLAPPTAPDVATLTRTATLRIEVDRERLEALATDGQRAEFDPARGIPITFSSEFPVERYDWWEDERYLEVLDHGEGAIDLSRAVRGLPFVDTHEIHSVSAQLGRVFDITRRPDGRLAGRLVLSQRQAARDYGRDLMDGLAGEVSVGYKIDPARVDRVTEEGQIPRYIVRRWTPHEVSAVTVPADPTVGAGRSMTPQQVAAHAVPRPIIPTRAETVAAASGDAVPSATIAAPKAEENAMSEVIQDTAPTGASTVHVTRAEGESPNSEARRRQLAETAREHGIEEVFARGMAEGNDTETISRAMFDALKERMKKGPQFAARVSLSEREQAEYSVSRAILLADTGENGFEREVSDDIAKRLPQGYKPAGGLFIPTNLGQTRTALEAGTSSLGGASVFTQYGGMIDLLRNNAFVIQAGATVLPGLDAPVSFVKQLTPGTAYWVDETPGSDVTESNMTFGLVSLTPKTLQATQAFSRQLLVQARRVMQAEQVVRNDLARIHALAIDAAAIAGTGTLQPLGITRSTNVGTVTLGAAGAVPTYDALVDQEVQVRNGNVAGELAYLTTPGIAGRLKKTQRFSSTDGQAVWTGDLINGTANGARAFATNQVPSNLTKGTSTTVCHAIIAGAFSNMMIGEFGAVEIITDPYAKKKQGLIEVTSFQMVDLNWRYDAAFSVILDAKLS